MAAGDRLRMEKKRLRARILAARDAMDFAQRNSASSAITQALLSLPGYKEASTVCAFVGFGSEFDTQAFIAETLGRGKTLLLPRVDRVGKSLAFHSVADPDRQLVPGTWGIREPDPNRCAAIPLKSAGFILVPGVAFSRSCDRLGYGGGFYDRALASLNTRTPKVSPGFSVQIVTELPVGPLDQKVDLVVTEHGCIESSEP